MRGHLMSAARIVLNRPPVAHRGHLPILLRLQGEGVEVGVKAGLYSETILRLSLLSRLFSVDPWKTYPMEVYQDISNAPQAEQEQCYQETVERLRRYQDRSRILRMTSGEAAGLFGEHALDFVYVDANHSYEACARDLELWWPKVKPGGVFAGHDYLDGELRKPSGPLKGIMGVKRAVNELVQRTRQRLWVTTEHPCPSWYVVKDVDRIHRLIPINLLLSDPRAFAP